MADRTTPALQTAVALSRILVARGAVFVWCTVPWLVLPSVLRKLARRALYHIALCAAWPLAKRLPFAFLFVCRFRALCAIYNLFSVG